MKKLPIGIQTFSEIRNGDYIYVDKTKFIAELIEGKYYFLSRPRRFGKSLLVDTLKQIFLGNKELFKGLWIEDQIDWQAYPVIHIDFNQVSYKDQGLRDGLKSVIAQIAREHQITLASSDLKEQFIQLIKDLYATYRQSVVILIDEYDKPIIDYLDNIPQAAENREILKTFYSPVKPLDPYLKFVLITGVSKFSPMSIFSDLNNLNDITTHTRYSQMLGLTWEEIEKNFREYLEELRKVYGDETQALIQYWYNGYSWDGCHFVYNPFSVLNLFDKYEFANYWFRTGTPTFLTRLVKTGNFNVPEFEQLVTTSSVLDKFEIESIELAGILFQTGYLTIKREEGEYYVLGYPNHEVRQSWFENLLAALNDSQESKNGSILERMKESLVRGQTETFMLLLKEIFANLTYQQIERKESYFHSIFYLTVKLLGMEIESEVLTSFGRIDVVIKTRDYIYVTEFKLGTATEALEQIRKMRYAEKYAGSGKQIILLGIGFDADQRTVGSWEEAHFA